MNKGGRVSLARTHSTMNTPTDRQVLTDALDAFHRSTGLHAELTDDGTPDPLVKVVTTRTTLRYAPTIKRKVDRASAALAALQSPEHPEATALLVAPHISPAIGQVCRENDLSFIDCAGNVFLKAPGTFVFVVGNAPAKETRPMARSRRVFGASGLRVIYNCLADPELFQSTYREIARASGTALGTVSGILGDLRAQGLLAEDKKGQRHWLSKERLAQAWMVNYPLALRPKLEPRRFRARNDDWWNDVDPLRFGMQWGGEVAAAKLASELIPASMTLYAHESLARLARAQRFTADPGGNIEVLDAFWPLPRGERADAQHVSPLLVCADLLSIADPRTIQAARVIQEKYLA